MPGKSTRVAVAGPSTTVSSASMAVVEEGGSVVDAGIAAALTAMCAEPGVCGPGGGGFLTIDIPGHEPVVIDGYMAIPGSGFTGESQIREVHLSYGGGVTTGVGPGSIAVPGAFAAFGLASDMFGHVPFKVLMSVVADHVSEFPMSFATHLYLSAGAAPIYESDTAASEPLFINGEAKPQGSSIVFPGLAESLRRIGDEGVESIYGGEFGKEIVADLEARGSRLTIADLASYRAEVRSPLKMRVANWELLTNPRPAVGGVVLVDALTRLGSDRDHSSMARALEAAFAAHRGEGTRSPSTISVAAADDQGGCVAGSFSAGYGSGVIPTGTGMLMNNALGEKELLAEMNELIPGARMISNMSPSVARSQGARVAFGSPGASRITSALMMMMMRLIEGDSVSAAVRHPRLHPDSDAPSPRLALEPGLSAELSGFDAELFEEQHMFFGGVNAAGLVGGGLVVEADPRRTGSVAVST